MSVSATLQERLSFIKLDTLAQEAIRNVKDILIKAIPAAIDAFYDQVRAFPQTANFFASEAQIAAARDKQIAHWEAISSGNFDENYQATVTRIGMAHARIGLDPRWYIGGYALLLEGFIGKILAVRLEEKGLFRSFRRQPKTAQIAAEISSVAKAILLDMDLSISVYLDAAAEERARHEALKVETAQHLTQVVQALENGLQRLSDGDLSHRLVHPLAPEFEPLRLDFNAALDKLQNAMSAVSTDANTIRSSTEAISNASDDLSRRTEQQAASLEETAAALDQITATVRQTAEAAARSNQIVADTRQHAERAGEVVTRAVEAMGSIEVSSRQIGEIIGVVDEIAFQTNLLALNAGVEAARAGEAGRGFAVVATEVRALAQRSADAAKKIKELISTSGSHVKTGVTFVGESEEALSQIVQQINEISKFVTQIAASAQEQASGLGQVNTAINQMDQVTQQNAAMVERSNAAARTLMRETDHLAELMLGFRLDASTSGPAGNYRAGSVVAPKFHMVDNR